MGPMPYVGMQSLLDPLWTPARTTTSPVVLDRAHRQGDRCADRLHVTSRRPPRTASAPSRRRDGRIPADATAFTHVTRRRPTSSPAPPTARLRRARRVGTRDPQAIDPPHRRCLRQLHLRPGQDKVPASYPRGATTAWSGEGRYDPTNLFRLNQNIPPATADRQPSRLNSISRWRSPSQRHSTRNQDRFSTPLLTAP